MNNRFRFRAYNPLKKQYFFDVQNMYDDEIECFGYMVDDIYKNGYIVEQCTGLKDKNGKLIYEGDIILVEDKYKCPIEWEAENARYNVIGYGEIAYLNYNEIEVIGNIHENPELLEDSDEG